jgi:Ca-activated chloride channel family protein
MSGIQNPLALLALPLLALATWLVAVQNGKRRERASRLGAPLSIFTTRLAFGWIIPSVLMTAALVRPYSGSSLVTVPAATEDYMLVVDVSRSMFARDVPPSRIELAKRKMRDLIDELTRQGTPHRYGVTLFAGHSYLLCPVTDDVSVIKQFISEISPAMVTSLGSNLEAGVSTALSRFSDSHHGRLLVLSDGEDDQLTLPRITTQISRRGIKVDVLGIGTLEGSPIQLEDGTFIKDQRATVVQSKLEEASLRAIASAGSGTYVRATLDDRDIRELARSSSPRERSANGGTRSIRAFQEFGSWLALIAALTIITIAAIPRSGSFLRALILFTLTTQTAFAAPTSPSAAAPPSGRAAYELYHSGRYQEASEAFKAALEESPNDTSLTQGFASSLYKEGNFKAALKTFQSLASKATNGREFFDNTYNAGTALLHMKRYQEAIDTFTKALEVKPDDERALHNRQVAQALLEEEERRAKEPTATPTPTPTGSPQASPEPSPESSPSPDESPQSQPQGSPDSSDAQTGSGSPSPPPEDEPTQSQEDPAASTTARAEPSMITPTPKGSPADSSAERLKETEDPEEPQSQTAPNGTTPALQTQSPSTKEAEGWIESLPESPLLIRRERGNPRPEGQTW